MPALFVYLLKVNIALTIFCLGYYVVLRHLTFYTLNRVYLVCALLFATLYPKIDLSDFVNRHQQIARPVQAVVINWQGPLLKNTAQPDYWYWLGLLFWAGVFLLAVRFAVQLFSLYRLYRRSIPAELERYRIRAIEGDVNPFSFWKSIYVNPDNHQPAELKAILAHEQIHVDQYHTLDILLSELSTIFYWFNPGVWLIKKAIRENVEFITDQKILQKGADCKAYQYSLLNVTFNTGSNAIVNHFNISTIKKRIMMMNSKRSSRINLTRYAFLLPAVAALLLIFSVSKAELTNRVSQSSIQVAKAIHAVARQIDVITQPVPPPPSVKSRAMGKKLMKSEVNIPTETFIDTPKKEKLTISIKQNPMDSAVVVINGKIQGTGKTAFASINPNEIASINVLRAGAATKALGIEDGKGVIAVTLKGSESSEDVKIFNDKVKGFTAPAFTVSPVNKNTTVTIRGVVSAKAALDSVLVMRRTDSSSAKMGKGYVSSVKVINSSRRSNELENKLIIIDGKVSTFKDLEKELAVGVSSMFVSTDADATARALYGEKAKNGLVIVTTKKK